jgi:hypothetical protein
MRKRRVSVDWRIRHWRWGQNDVGASLLAFLIQQRRDECFLEKDTWGVKIIWAQD